MSEIVAAIMLGQYILFGFNLLGSAILIAAARIWLAVFFMALAAAVLLF